MVVSFIHYQHRRGNTAKRRMTSRAVPSIHPVCFGITYESNPAETKTRVQGIELLVLEKIGLAACRSPWGRTCEILRTSQCVRETMRLTLRVRTACLNTRAMYPFEDAKRSPSAPKFSSLVLCLPPHFGNDCPSYPPQSHPATGGEGGGELGHFPSKAAAVV